MTSQKVCLVTGASRGIGKGCALALAKAGHCVYITGRTVKSTARAPGTVRGTEDEINACAQVKNSGGRCVAVICDHANDDEVRALFARISKDAGRLDLLVNNAYAGVNTLFEHMGKPFWDKPLAVWEASHRVGLRSAYVASALAVPLLRRGGNGLIVNISSVGARTHFADTAYGVGKAALDRLTSDLHLEFRQFKTNIAVVSLWPGAVKTELTMTLLGAQQGTEQARTRSLFEAGGESLEFTGMCVCALLRIPQAELLERQSGQVLLTAELALEYGFTDDNGKIPLTAANMSPQALRTKVMARPAPYYQYVPKASRL